MNVSLHHHLSFLERMGHTIREASGLYWFNTNRGVYCSFPYLADVDASSLDLSAVLGRDGLVARFGCPLDQGIESFRILCSDPDYGFPSLRSRTRTQVRRGLESCHVRQVDFSVLEKHAIPLNADTLIRQGRKVPRDLAAYWSRYYAAAAATEGAEAWAAFAGDELAAYLISFTIEDTANLLIVRSSSKHLDLFPNNALIFEFLSTRLRSADVRQVSYGYESLQSDLGTLDQFKTGMGFQKVPVGQRIEVAPLIRPFLNRTTSPMMLRILNSLGPGESIAKLRGILSWYQQQPALPARPWLQRVA